MVTKISEVKYLIETGVSNPKTTFSEIRKMAESDDWKVREVAATVLVEISKNKADEVISEMVDWADDIDPNVRRTSSEGLRDLARKNPEKVLPVIEKLKTDENLYVKKSVANVLRNASRYNSGFVLGLCKNWAFLKNKNTDWIIKGGLRKLKESHSKQVDDILGSLGV
ncbi:MAG: DNA alkylation repair protein [archaeon]